jgi:hypothetical protein
LRGDNSTDIGDQGLTNARSKTDSDHAVRRRAGWNVRGGSQGLEHESSLARTTNGAPFGYPVKGAFAKSLKELGRRRCNRSRGNDFSG